ncbi:MAG TPA: hypothetical protein VKE74_12690, partial [Gemmataceae bacterium]|nr:hypothetical protein [Gemmataceae bacterium]
MTSSRRSVVLAAAFLGLACLLVGGRSAHAQRQRPPYGPPPPPRGPEMQPFGPQYGQRTHDIWEPQVSADEVRDAFKRGRPGNSGELPPGFEKLVPGLTEEFQKQFPEYDARQSERFIRELLAHPDLRQFPPEVVDQAIRSRLADPDTRKQIRDGVQKGVKKGSTQPGSPPDAKQLPDPGKLIDTLPKEGPGALPKITPGNPPNGPPGTRPMIDPKVGPDTLIVRPKATDPITPGKEPDPANPKTGKNTFNPPPAPE